MAATNIGVMEIKVLRYKDRAESDGDRVFYGVEREVNALLLEGWSFPTFCPGMFAVADCLVVVLVKT